MAELRPEHLLPYSSLLNDLARLVTPDGASHVVESPRGQLLCGRPRPLEAKADTAWRGAEASRLATCPACSQAAARIVAGAGQEAAHLEATAGPVAKMIKAHAEGDRAQVRLEAERLESRNYVWFWVALVLSALTLSLGALDLGYFVGFLGCAMRLVWLIVRRPLLKSGL